MSACESVRALVLVVGWMDGWGSGCVRVCLHAYTRIDNAAYSHAVFLQHVEDSIRGCAGV